MNDLKAIEKRLMLLTGSNIKNNNKDKASDKNTITKTEVGDIHATTSSLKSFTTTIVADGLEDCRKSCGGHGFLASSGLPEKSTTYLVHPTVEGDNHMLPMQVVKVLLKLVKDVQIDYDKATENWERCEANYLLKPVKTMLDGLGLGRGGIYDKCGARSKDDFMNVNLCLRAYQHRSARLLVEVANQIQEDMTLGGKSFEDAWNSALIQMQRISRAHSLYLLLNNFVNGIHKERKSKLLGPNEEDVLKDLALLFGLYWIDKEDGEFLADGYLSSEQIQWVRSCVLTMLDKIRPNAVALVDANDFPDFVLQSALGRFDGNVYEAILQQSKKDPLNATEPGPGYEEHLKRLIVDGLGVYSGTASRL